MGGRNLEKTLGLVSCTKSKRNQSCSAKDMYQASDLFKKAYEYAISHCDCVGILSAKYGFLLPDEKIEPYELTLTSMSEAEREEWARQVFMQMKEKIPMNEISKVFFHTGILYRKHLMKILKDHNIDYDIPLEGLGLGKQKAWYLARSV